MKSWIILILVLSCFNTRADDFHNIKNGNINSFYSASKLRPNPVGEGGGSFGVSIDVDNERAVVGGNFVSGTGAAFLYEFDGSVWTKSKTFKPTQMLDVENYGIDVSISGNRIVVGCGVFSSCAYVYEFDEENWNLEALLTPDSIQEVGSFGNVVDIYNNKLVVRSSEDESVFLYSYTNGEWLKDHVFTPPTGFEIGDFGSDLKLLNNRLIIGQPGRLGAVHVYDFEDGEWHLNSIEQPNLNHLYSDFGGTVSAFNNELLIGASSETRGGAAYLYELLNGNWQLMEYFKPDEIGSNEDFGGALDISATQLLIGASNDNAIEHSMGAVFVYEKSNNIWSFIQKIVPSDISEYKFYGNSVGLSDTSLLVGAYVDDNQAGINAGAVYVIDQDGDEWEESQKLTNSEGSNRASFGESIKIFGDFAVLGAPDQRVEQGFGRVYIFELINERWERVQSIDAPSGSSLSSFGSSTAINNEFLVVGNLYFNDTGTVNIYKMNKNGNYSNMVTIFPDDGDFGDYFGSSVSLEGERLFIGAPGNGEYPVYSGSVYVYEYDNLTEQWIFSTKITNDKFISGQSLGASISSWEDKILVEDSSGSAKAYIFSFNGSEWSQESLLDQNDGIVGQSYRSNNSLKLINNKAIMGVMNGGGGIVYVFEYIKNNWVLVSELSASEGDYSNFGSSVDATDHKVVVGAYNDNDLGQSAGAVYSFTKENDQWINEFKYKGFDTYSKDYFGYAVSLKGNKMLVGAPGDDDHGTSSGSAYFINTMDLIFKNNLEAITN